MPARSLPAFGSDHPWHHRSSAAGHAEQDPVLLLVGAELEDRRRKQEDAVLGDALRPASPVVLLFEDQPLHRRRAPPAVGLWPGHDGAPRVEERTFPFEVRGETLTRVARRQPVRNVRFEPGAALGAERLLRLR